jgi:ABC-type xylose transport system substrate-binding protein
VSFQLRPDWNIVGSHHDCNSALIAAGAREGPQPVIDGKGDKQADSQRQAPNH